MARRLRMHDPNNPCHYCKHPITVAAIPLPGRPATDYRSTERRACHVCAHRKVEELYFVVFDNENEQTASLRFMKFCDSKHELLRGRRFGDTSELPSGRSGHASANA
jgi:hypothetical protein